MAKNDMLVILYKMLAYLDECSKAGKQPRYKDMAWESELYSVPQAYWESVIREATDEGFIRGFSYRETKDGTVIQQTGNIGITLKGAEYLADNGTMQKVKNATGEAFRVIVQSIISTYVPTLV